jgi:SAM-dependent methyltransferase
VSYGRPHFAAGAADESPRSETSVSVGGTVEFSWPRDKVPMRDRMTATLTQIWRRCGGCFNTSTRLLRLNRPEPGRVRFGHLRRIAPISKRFGFDRGLPIDRYYIEQFLEARSCDIQGRVLEVGDSTYTTRYGGDRVRLSDVLHVEEGNPQATIVADLASADHIPDEIFDCIILTQTLQLVYDVPKALRTLERIMRPGGVLLATVPGISQTSDETWGPSWYWSFTPLAMRRLLSDAFQQGEIEVDGHGNVLAASCFLFGLATQELRRDELAYTDRNYAMLVTARVVKTAKA